MEFERHEKRPERLTVRVTTKAREGAESAAKKAGVSMSEFIRAALREATAEVLGQQS